MKLKKSVLVLSMMGLSTSTYAQNNTAKLDTIEVTASAQNHNYISSLSNSGSKIEAPLKDIPQTINVVPQQIIKDTNATSMQDILERTPGISASLGDAQRDQVTIRGFLAINDQFVDGLRDDALYYRDIANIEKVEVVKGPIAALYGRGNAGGIINRITKKPQANQVNEVSYLTGSYGKNRSEFDVGNSTANQSAQFRVTGAIEDSGNFRNQFFLERQTISPSLRLNFSPRTSLLIQTNFLHDKRLADQGVVGDTATGRPINVPINYYYGSANGKEQAFVETDVKDFTATLDHDFANDMHWKNTFRAYDYYLDRNYTVNSKGSPTLSTVTIDRSKRIRDEHGWFWQSELSHDLSLGSTKHQLLYGIELGKQNKIEQFWNQPKVATYNLYNPQLQVLPDITNPIVRDFQTSIDIASIYAQDLITFTPQWKALVGARFDHLKQIRDNRLGSNGDLARTDKTISPRLGLVYQPTNALSFYASVGQSSQPIAESYVFYKNSDQLKPEKTTSYEIGSKWDMTSNSFLTASLFFMTRDNIQNADPLDPLNAIAVGQQTVKGIELSYGGKIGQHIDISAGYALLDGEISKSSETYKNNAGQTVGFLGNKPALTPRHSASILTKYTFDNGIYLDAGFKVEGQRFASASNKIALPGYARWDLGAGYSNKNMDVNLTLKNVANRKYFISGHSGADHYNMFGEPRNVQLAVRYKF